MSTTATRTGRPAAKPARTSANSETNIPNGGSPITASMPAAKKPPVHGMTRSRPDTPSISAVPYRRRTRPASRNIIDLATLWLSRCSMAANTPSGPRARPTQMSPVCSMLE